MNLSKSRYVAFRQCPKVLWLSINEPVEAAEADESRMAAGIAVGNLAKGYFGTYKEATATKADGCLDIPAMIARTKTLMADSSVETICEAAFLTDGCYCAVDLLHREKGGWAIYEVKSSSGDDFKDPDEVYIMDIAYQRYVLEQCGVKITGTYLMRLDRNYVLQGDLDTKALFYIDDVKNSVSAEYPKVAPNCAKAKEILSLTTEPDKDLHEGCNAPYECAFKAYCMKAHNVPSPSVFDLYRMSWKKALEMYQNGKVSFESLRDEKAINEHQRMQIESTLQNVDLIDKVKIRSFLSTLKYPIYQLDFETIQPAIPVYQGTHPYQQVPTQYSLHIQPSAFGDCEHLEFLADAKSENPMREVAEHLCNDIPANVMVMAYNAGFEKGRIKEMADAFPDLRNHLMAIHGNVVDLLVPFRDWAYYRPAMNGSFSIKKVLPALFPNDPRLDYHKLPGCVHNGGEAMDIFPKMRNMEGQELADTRESLLRYCELDTWSMVVVLRKLYEVSK